MRMMLKITFPTDTANSAFKDGSFSKLLEATMSKLKPEAAYFLSNNGCRCAMVFFDMQDSSEIPSIAEPLFLGLNVQVEFEPVMNLTDLQKGLAAAMQAR
jgi:hypothetical protein